MLGGEGALSNEALMGREIEYTIRNVAHGLTGSKTPPPKRLELPKPAHLARAEEQAMGAKERAWHARQQRNTDG